MLRCIQPDWPAPDRVLALATTRQGGSSRAPFDALNLAGHVGDAPGAVATNREILHSLLPRDTRIQWLNQCHGTAVIKASDAAVEAPEADASWVDRPGVACAVLTADCLPLLLCDRAGTVVASAHAGWRGLLAGILERTVAAVPAEPANLLAWLGPAIGPAAFEVGPEVRDAFCDAPGADALEHACFRVSALRSGHWVADLYALARLRLRRVGVDRVYGGDFCTARDPRRFFSYRRDGSTGRMASLIQLKPD